MDSSVPDPPDGDEAPDSWDAADRAYDRKWSDDPQSFTESSSAEPNPLSPPPLYTPTEATPRSVSDAYAGGMAEAGPYIGLGVQIAASMALFAGGGYAVDQWLGTSPWGILVGATLGMIGIMALIVRVAREADAESARRKKL